MKLQNDYYKINMFLHCSCQVRNGVGDEDIRYDEADCLHQSADDRYCHEEVFEWSGVTILKADEPAYSDPH